MPTFEPWAEIDIGAIAANVRALKGRLVATTQFLVAVKANAYGHGTIEVAQAALSAGADWLGVARLSEGIALREAGITAPILIFCPTAAEALPEIVRHTLTPSVSDAKLAQGYSKQLGATETLALHYKIDTGMGRLGFLAQHDGSETGRDVAIALVAQEAKNISALPNIHLSGAFTHFASADNLDPQATLQQFDLFTNCLSAMQKLGVQTSLRHAANSAAIIRHPSMHLDMVRAGISVYGLGLPEDQRQGCVLRPALCLKARIALLKRLPKGGSVSYGMTYRSDGTPLIATIPIGYGDGYARAHSGRGFMLVRGQRAPIVGRVCMDSTMIDVSNIDGVTQGDEVVIIGNQGNEQLGASEVGEFIGSIDYEVVTALTERIRRIYV